MSVRLNENKWWKCTRIRRGEKEGPLEVFRIRAKNKKMARKYLNVRFFLKKGELWSISRIKDFTEIEAAVRNSI